MSLISFHLGKLGGIFSLTPFPTLDLSYGLIDMSADELHIGRRDAHHSHVDGIIDEVRIYRRALAPAEIRELARRR